MSDTVEFIELACSNNEHKIGVATLDNPSSLNALSFDMLVSLKDKLELCPIQIGVVPLILIVGKGFTVIVAVPEPVLVQLFASVRDTIL